MNIMNLKRRFIEVYGGTDDGLRIFSSPGRVNLIGEHTDYNGGYVFPAALTLSSTVVARPRRDRVINLMATDLDIRVTASLDTLEKYKDLKWGSYQLGVADELQKAGFSLVGCDMLFHDTVPFGSGLSSSAAIEVATAITLVSLGGKAGLDGKSMDMVEIAKICQLAENNYIGVKCGIMDQFASAMGKADHAILLDCRDLSFQHIPLDIKGFKIVLANTRKKRSLAAEKYNERRSECEKGLEILKATLPGIQCLGDVHCEQFEQYKHRIADEIVRNRVKHVVYENDRVLRSVDALQTGNLLQFGQYMIQSHHSLRDLYEVTGEELDTLVEAALEANGVIGSRMTGAGFGGCTVSIVREDAVDEFIASVGEKYYKRLGIKAEFYVSEIGEGGREITGNC